jgi:hypothetical protein
VPARRPDFTEEQVAQALTAARGKHSRAAQALCCHERTIANYIQRFPALKEVEQRARSKVGWLAEDVLVVHLENGSLDAAKFALQKRDPDYAVQNVKAEVQTSGPLTMSMSDSVVL